ERRKFASEKLKVQVSLAKLVPEVEAAQQGSKAAASQSAVRRREASSSQAEQTSRVQALEDSLRGSKAQLAEANRRLELESSALDRVSSELGQHRGLASSVNENLDSELQRRREETGWQLEALTDQLSAARREADECVLQLHHLRASASEALPERAGHELHDDSQAELARLQLEGKHQRERHTALRQ
ncbi:unnamed protein product, partial [Polarella glacialis]